MIHPGALGDVLLAIPALRALKRQWPDERLCLAAQPRIGALLAALEVVDEWSAFESLGLEPLFVDDGEPVRVAAVQAAARVMCWFGAGEPVFVRRLSALAPGARIASPAPEAGTTVWERLVVTTGASAADGREPVPVAPALEDAGRRALAAAGWDGAAPLVMIHPGAGGLAKRWPAEGFAGVLDAVDEPRRLTVVLHAGPADGEAVAALTARLARPTVVLRDPPLPALAGALRHVRAYLGNDSGVSHLAAAVGAPALILFTASSLAWRPWSPAARLLTVSTATLEPADVTAALTAFRALVS